MTGNVPVGLRRLFLSGAALLVLAGCSSEYWAQPSPLNRPPPGRPTERQARQENKGGFTVLVDAPGQPDAARVVADVGAYARGRGFAGAGPERYLLGGVTLDVIYRSTDHQVSAYLHGSRLSKKFSDGFYQDFDRQYARGYGSEDPILENDYIDDAAGPFRGNGPGPGAERRGGGR